MKIVAKPNAGKPGFKTTFRHPIDKNVVTHGLGTTDTDEAERICRDAVLIFSDPELLKDSKNPRLLAYHDRAVSIVFGKPAAENLAARREKPALDSDDIGTLAVRILAAIDAKAAQGRRREILIDVLRGYESKRYGELQKEYERQENAVKVLRPRCEELEAEIQRLRRQYNVHVKVSLAAAVAVWLPEYEQARAEITASQAKTAVHSFRDSIKDADKFKLGDVRAKHIDEWLAGLKGIGQVSKKRMRAYVSSFFTWATRRYELVENPMRHTGAVEGVARLPENIVAIRREHEVNELLDGLSGYWQAWVAFAVLAGPRWAEQQWLKVDDVYLDGMYVRITSRASGKRLTGTKTGRERNVPIERTKLAAILKAHVERRQAERKKRKATPAEASPWLFPSTLDERADRKRVKSEVGQWSHSRAFLDAWDAARAVATKKMKTVPTYWNYGPAEWRHCAATCMGHADVSAIRIADWIGTSERMVNRHYRRPSTEGKAWGFKW